MAVIASLVLLVHAAQAQDEPRWALVIGNKDYQHVPTLTTPVNDAHAVAGALKELGFTVLPYENLDRAGMYDAVDTFADRILNGVAVVYYAGHGVRIGSTNYLLPIDNWARSERDVENDALPLDRVLRQLAGARAKLVVVFVDACRDNPLPPAPTRGGLAPPGLAPPETPSGTMVVFSAGANQRALDLLPGDDPSSNGLFARELLRELRRPGVPLDQAVRNARNRVYEEARSVGHLQNPAIYDELVGGEFYLSPPESRPPSPASSPAQLLAKAALDLLQGGRQAEAEAPGDTNLRTELEATLKEIGYNVTFDLKISPEHLIITYDKMLAKPAVKYITVRVFASSYTSVGDTLIGPADGVRLSAKIPDLSDNTRGSFEAPELFDLIKEASMVLPGTEAFRFQIIGELEDGARTSTFEIERRLPFTIRKPS